MNGASRALQRPVRGVWLGDQSDSGMPQVWDEWSGLNARMAAMKAIMELTHQNAGAKHDRRKDIRQGRNALRL